MRNVARLMNRPSDQRASARPLIGWRGKHVVITNWKDGEHPEAGGAELYCEAVASAIARHGAYVTLLTSRPAGASSRQAREYGQVVRRGGRFTTYLRGLAWLARKRRQIDAVIDSQAGIPYFSPLAVSRRTPVVLVIHHVHQEQFAEYFPKPLSLVGRFAERQGTNAVYGRRPLCAVSPSTSEDVRARLGLRGPMFIAPNALSVAADRCDAADDKGPRERSANPTIVTVSRLVRHKRHELLLASLPESISRHPDLHVHLVGDGDAVGDLRLQASTLGVADHVTFHGRLPAAARDDLLARAWISATTSAREGWGVAVIEAAALGVPTVALSVPGLRDSIRDGETGYLVDDLADFGSAIADVLDELALPAAAQASAARCKAWAASFSWDATAAHLLNALNYARRGRAERRAGHDAATVVVLPSDPDQAPEMSSDRVAGLRATDLMRHRDGHLELLLSGCDVTQARAVAARLGLTGIELRPAVGHDLLGWQPINAGRSDA